MIGAAMTRRVSVWAVRAEVLPLVLVGLLGCGLLFGLGVAAAELARCAAYELFFVFAPGILLFRVVSAGRTVLEQVAFGWALGYVLEIGAFAVTGTLGLREWFVAYPVIAFALALAIGWRAHARGSTSVPRLSARHAWATAAVAALMLVYLTLEGFATTPLPWQVERVWYYVDLPFHLSIAAEAKNHWPVTDASAAGLPFPYHVWANLHMAAMGQVTDVPLPVVVFRIFPAALTLLVILQIVAAGRRLLGRTGVGVAAAALILLVGEVDFDPDRARPFAGTFAWSFWVSPSFLLALACFIPAVVLIAGRLADGTRTPTAWREWLLIGAFAVGAAGAKATTPLVLLGGLFFYLAWGLAADRRLDRVACAGLIVVASATSAVFVGLYQDAGRRDLEVSPLGAFRAMPQLAELQPAIGETVAGRGAFLLLAPFLGYAALYGAALAGIPFLIRSRRRCLGPTRRFLFSLLLAGSLPLLIVHQGGFSELYFSHFGLAAGGLLSAEGLLALEVGKRRAAGALGGVALVAVLVVTGLTGSAAAAYVILVVLLVLLVLLGIRRGRTRPLLGLAAGVAVLAGALDLPLDVGSRAIPAWRDGEPLYVESEVGVTRDLYRGLAWVRDHTSTDAVLAVNNQEETDGSNRYPSYYSYAAFAERRVFLQGWLYGPLFLKGEADVITPRLKLNEAVFQRADRRALARLIQEYGVRYLVVDHVHGASTPRIDRLGEVVYANPDVTIYAVRL